VKPVDRTWTLPPQGEHESLLDAVIATRGLGPLDLEPPTMKGTAMLLHDMPQAVDILCDAIDHQELTAVYGDYDVDGGTAAAILYRGLKAAGANILVPYVPERTEGYGLQCSAIEDFAAQGVAVITTVDNGTNARQAVALAKSKGMRVVVTDHHPAQRGLDRHGVPYIAEPDALVNPQLPSAYPFHFLCGAGVAFHVLLALQEQGRLEHVAELIPYAAVGTIADVMPLTSANRLLVQIGMQQARLMRCVPLAELYMEATRRDREYRRGTVTLLTHGRIPSSVVGFGMAPLLNSAGRMGEASVARDLLITDDPEQARHLVERLVILNTERKHLQDLCEAEAVAMAEALPEDRAVIALASPRWQHGIVGPVAARLTERFARPTYLGAVDAREEGETEADWQKRAQVHGSARTASGLDCGQLLEGTPKLEGGGHAAAAGFAVRLEDWDDFAATLESNAQTALAGRQPAHDLNIDAVWPLPASQEVTQTIDTLEPTGQEFREPVVLTRDLIVERAHRSTRNPDSAYCRLTVSDGKRKQNVTAFDQLPGVEPGQRLDIAYTLTSDGLHLKDFMRPAERPYRKPRDRQPVGLA
jgi:single-stranded-DNA-specific exonuclease